MEKLKVHTRICNIVPVSDDKHTESKTEEKAEGKTEEEEEGEKEKAEKRNVEAPKKPSISCDYKGREKEC